MHEYPIFKHLIQFSNLIDSKNELIPVPKTEEVKKPDDLDNDEGNEKPVFNGVNESQTTGGNVMVSSLPPTANPSKWQRNYDNLSS